MRKITSHYSLKPDGTWAKRPIIELDDAGTIIGFREMGDDFAEEPNLEYFPGIVVPTFLIKVHSASLDKALVNRSVVEGTRRFVVDKEMQFGRGMSVVKNGFTTGSIQSPWIQIKKDVSQGIELAEAIMRQTQKIAQQFSLDEKWGVIKKGAQPGLLLLQGIDLKNFTITANTQMKVLVE